MKRIIAFIVCLLMVLHLAPTTALPVIAEDTTTEYYAEWSIGTIRIYADPNDSVNVLYRVPSQFYSSTFTVKYHGNVNGKDWYYATDVYWSHKDYQREDYRYIPASSINILGVVQPEITYGEIKAGVGNFSVSIDGAPTDATLSLKQIKEKDYDYEAIAPYITNRMLGILDAYDLSIYRNGAKWQPEEGKTVTVKMNALALGLFNDELLYVIREHENDDGTKEYKTFGPLTVENGFVSFETEKFSDHYLLKGTHNFSVPEPSWYGDVDNYYLEPGTVMTLTSNYYYNTTFTESANNSKSGVITYSNNQLVIAPEAKSGDSATIKITSYYSSGTSTVNIYVRSSQELVERFINNGKLMIAILNQRNYQEGNFPSEPGNTEGTYFHIEDLNGDGTYKGQTASTNFNNTASNYLDPTMANSSAWMYSATGTQIYGLVDPTGRETKEAFKNAQGDQTVDWDQIAEIIANYNDEQDGTNNDLAVKYNQEGEATAQVVYLTKDPTYTINYYKNRGESVNGKSVYYGEFKLIPYVIKYMTNNNKTEEGVWHVDVAVIRGDSYLLGYDLNLGDLTLVSGSSINLPDAKVYVESPYDNDTVMQVTLATWNYKNTTYTVTNEDGTRGQISFKGWWTSPTATTDDKLYQPGDTITLSTNETKLYAIWNVSQSLKKSVNSITLYNSIALVSNAPTGSRVPRYGEPDFVKFNYSLNLVYSDWYKDVEFSITKMTGVTNGITDWTTITATIPEIIASPTTYSDYIVIGDTNITLYLYGGENVKFSNVPVYQQGSNTAVNSFTFTQTITEKTDKYSTQDNGTMSTTRTIPAAMSEVTPTSCQVYTYYIPPVVGLHITTENGGANESFIFTVTYKTDVDAIDPITLVVPAGGEVTVTQCITGNYEIKCISTWDTLYSTSTTSTTVTLTEGKDSYVTFTYSFNGKKYIYGYSHSTKTVREG